MSLFEQVQNQLKASYKHLNTEYDQSLFDQLLEPQNIVDKKITITMDDGSDAEFQVYRSQHSNVRGPYK
jgi:glutamate dehydrogenase/leucine dehydrogenase